MSGNTAAKTVLLAFSGGLDTSFCVPWLKEKHDARVITVTVNTGGFTTSEIEAIEKRAAEVGASSHVTIDAKDEFFDTVLRHLIAANALKGGVYPYCVGSERVVQVRKAVEIARELGADAIAHGCTGAGNDQVRFDSVLAVLAPEIEAMAPIRELAPSREEEAEFLTERGFAVDASTKAYSVNRGLWGTTIGGMETHSANLPLPEEAYVLTAGPGAWPSEPETVEIGFEKGVPVSLNGEAMDPVAIIETLEPKAARHGIGRGMHLGDTVLGFKGRVAFEAPAASVLIPAHRELEKLVLTKWQAYWKEQVAPFYGMMLHEGGHLDPAMRDLEAFLDSTQQRVTGTATVRLYAGQAFVLGVESPFDMMKGATVYGERAGGWTPENVEGFGLFLAMGTKNWHLAGQGEQPISEKEPFAKCSLSGSPSQTS